jgi:hypothetical protein
MRFPRGAVQPPKEKPPNGPNEIALAIRPPAP